VSYKKFNANDRGHRAQTKDNDKVDGRKPLRCCVYGGENHRRDCPQHQGGNPQICLDMPDRRGSDHGFYSSSSSKRHHHHHHHHPYMRSEKRDFPEEFKK